MIKYSVIFLGQLQEGKEAGHCVEEEEANNRNSTTENEYIIR